MMCKVGITLNKNIFQDDYHNHNLSTNNCRLENINASKLYYPALKDGGRCVVAVEGFYEWQTTNKSTKIKQPYYIYAEQSIDIQVSLIYCSKINSIDILCQLHACNATFSENVVKVCVSFMGFYF